MDSEIVSIRKEFVFCIRVSNARPENRVHCCGSSGFAESFKITPELMAWETSDPSPLIPVLSTHAGATQAQTEICFQN